MRSSHLWKRKKLVVSPAFQWGIVIKIVILAALVTGLFTWTAFYFVWKKSLGTGNISFLEVLYEPGLWVGLTLCLLLSLAISAYILLKVTHRIAGQLYRFEQAIDGMVCGDTVHPVFTRKDDYFHDFEAELNRLINKEN